MQTIKLSNHSLTCAACPRRYWYYRIQQRVTTAIGFARLQGIAGHAGLAVLRRGGSDEQMVEAIQEVYATVPPPPADVEPDYRTAAYLVEAVRQYWAEFDELNKFDFEEIEEPFELSLGIVSTRQAGDVEVIWTGRRDVVAVYREDGRRYIMDNKFVSRDDKLDLAADQNSRALKGYVWSCLKAHPDRLIAGGMIRRSVIRKPTKDKPLNFSFPLDPPVFIPQSRIDEWQADTLRVAAVLLERDPAKAEMWTQEESCCRRVWGVCDYLPVCTLPPEDRSIKLASDAYRDVVPHAAEKD